MEGIMEKIFGVSEFKVNSGEMLDYIFSKYFNKGNYSDFLENLGISEDSYIFYNGRGVYEQILEFNPDVEVEDVDAAILARLCEGKTKFSENDFADYFKTMMAANCTYDVKPLHKLSDDRIKELNARIEELSDKKSREEWSRAIQDNRDDVDEIYGKHSTDSVDYDKSISVISSEIQFIKSMIDGKPVIDDIEHLVSGFSDGKGYFEDIRTILNGENEKEDKNESQQSIFDLLNRDDK